MWSAVGNRIVGAKLQGRAALLKVPPVFCVLRFLALFLGVLVRHPASRLGPCAQSVARIERPFPPPQCGLGELA
jgi:hypothetical protein